MFGLKSYAATFALVIGLLTAFGQRAQGQTIINPSFETDNVPASPGYGAIMGWTVTGFESRSGINDATGPFADNGAIPDGQKVAFLHQPRNDNYRLGGTLRQTVSGFTVGAQYRLRYFENASLDLPFPPGRRAYLQASVGGAVVVPIQYDPADPFGITTPHEVLRVGGTNPYVLKVSEPFTATAESLEIVFSTGGRYDYTVLLDNVSVLPDSVVGANLVVTNNLDSGAGSLRQAVIDAPAFSTIRFSDVVRGAISLTTAGITINKNLTIVGPGADLLTVHQGGFGVDGGKTVVISGLTIADGTGIGNFGNLTLTDSVVRNNSSTGIYSVGNLTVVNSVLSDNAGGAILTACPTPKVHPNYLICLVPNQLTITNSNISHNRSQIGAGINISISDVVITNSSITGNVASKDPYPSEGSGAGIHNKGGRLTITNSTIAGNEDENYTCIGPCLPGSGGDGITTTYVEPILNEEAVDGQTNLINATVTDDIGGGVYARNSIISGFPSSQGNNLSINPGADPRLAPLGYYGGTTMTRPLLTGSPAINAGNTAIAPNTDQRGAARVGTADIGAFELNNSSNSGNFVAQLPDAFTEIVYNHTLVEDTSQNGTLAFTYSLTGGALPTGISFSTTQSQRVLVSGRTSQTGVFAFSVTATDTFDATNSFVTDYRLRVLASGLPPVPGGCRSNVVVANNLDSGEGTLRQAVIDACPDGTITFGEAGRGRISLTTGPIDINKNLTIAGPGADALTIRNGAGKGSLSRVIIVNSGVTAVIAGLTVSDGYGDGAGILNSGNLTVRNAVITNNQSAGVGGGILSGGTLTLINSVVTGNGELGFGYLNGISRGGGIYLSSGSATITDSTVSGNSANEGGGIYADSNSSVTITNSTIGENSATSDSGGGLYLYKATATLTNCTVSRNSAREGGGGIYMDQFFPGTLTLINTTVTDNQADSTGAFGGGGGISNFFGLSTVNAKNSIIAGNRNSGIGAAPDFNGKLTSQGYNLIGSNEGAQITGVTTGNIVGTNASLGPLADNGGPTKTHALLTGSPAINTGNTETSPATDQRGAARVGTADIGAYELNNSANSGAFVRLPDGRVQTPYSHTVADFSTYDGFLNNYRHTYTVTSGALPDGISLLTTFSGFQTTERQIVKVSGTTNQTGVFNFTVTATDRTNSSVINYRLVIGDSNSTPTPTPTPSPTPTPTITPTPTPTATPTPTITPTPTPSPTPTPNTPPNALNDVSSVNEDATLNINAPGVLGNDTDNENNSLTAVVQTSPANAASFALNADGSFSYTPKLNFNGTDSFTYTASDGNSSSNAATVTITIKAVNDNPDAINDPATVAEDSGANTVNVLGNDSISPDTGETLIVSFVTNGANGAVAITGGGTNVSYTPNANFNGTDSFTYTISDGSGGSDTATVNLTVTPVNDPPSFTRGTDQAAFKNSAAQTINNWATDISKGPADESNQVLAFNVTNDNNGLFSAQPAIDPISGNLKFTPALNMIGTATVSVTLSDNGGTTSGGQNTSLIQTFVITIVAPPSVSMSFAPPSIQTGSSSVLTVTIGNTNLSTSFIGVSMIDSLPAGVTAADGTASKCGGTLSIVSNVITLSGATIAPNTSCVSTITVTGTTAGLKNNLVTVNTANAGNGHTAAANLTVIAPPTIGKTFSPNAIIIEKNSIVTLSLTNSNTTGALTNASFTDNLVNMSATGGAVGGTCVGTSPNNLASGATALSFSGITIPSNSSCTVTFQVTSIKPGLLPNTTSGVTTAQTPIAGAASNTTSLRVSANPPAIHKSFTPSVIQPGGASVVTMFLNNQANLVDVTNASFTDNLINMTAVGGLVGGTCLGTAPNTLTAGDTNLTFTGITIPARSICTVTFSVTSNKIGSHPNQVTGITTNESIGVGPFAATTNLIVGVRTNVALAANGGAASASSELPGAEAGRGNDGVRNWATLGAWKDATPNAFPDILQIDFAGTKTMDEIDVIAVKDDYTDPSDPTDETMFSQYGITDFAVEYWNGVNWVTVPNGSITNNDKVIRKLTFAPITTNKIRVVVNNAKANYSRIVELEAWGGTGSVTPTPTPTPSVTPTVTPTPAITPNSGVTPTPTPTQEVRMNVALTSNGGSASASSQQNGGEASKAVDGIKNWATSGTWKDLTADVYPDWLEVAFNGSKTINEIDVYGVRDDFTNSSDPSAAETFTSYGITNFELQYWNGSAWVTVPNGAVVNNDKVITKLTFAAITTTKIRVFVTNAKANYSRIVELEAWGGNAAASTPTPTPTPTVTPTPTPTPAVRTNFALATNGSTATASSQLSGGAPSIAIDGIRNWATSGAWKDATPDAFPDFLEVNFNANKTIDEIDVYAVKDDFSNPADPTATEMFSIYGITNFELQYWNGASWTTVPNGSITNNNRVLTKVTFAPITTTKIRVVVNNAQSSHSRIVELEAWGN